MPLPDWCHEAKRKTQHFVKFIATAKVFKLVDNKFDSVTNAHFISTGGTRHFHPSKTVYYVQALAHSQLQRPILDLDCPIILDWG